MFMIVLVMSRPRDRKITNPGSGSTDDFRVALPHVLQYVVNCELGDPDSGEAVKPPPHLSGEYSLAG